MATKTVLLSMLLLFLFRVAECPPVWESIRFTMHDLHERLSVCLCDSSLLVLRVGCGNLLN